MSTGKWQVLWSPSQHDKFITFANEICLYKVTRSQVKCDTKHLETDCLVEQLFLTLSHLHLQFLTLFCLLC